MSRIIIIGVDDDDDVVVVIVGVVIIIQVDSRGLFLRGQNERVDFVFGYLFLFFIIYCSFSPLFLSLPHSGGRVKWITSRYSSVPVNVNRH